jgi:hypothetical protein
MSLMKAFNLFIMGIILPYAFQASTDRRHLLVAYQVAAMSRPSDNQQKPVPDTNECPICLSGMTVDNSRVTPCRHANHETCLITWLTENVTCPLCRHVIHRANDYETTWVEMVGNLIRLALRQQELVIRVRWNGIRAAMEQQDNEQLLQLQLQPVINWWGQMMPRLLLPHGPAQIQQRPTSLVMVANRRTANAPQPYAQAHGVSADDRLAPYVLY